MLEELESLAAKLAELAGRVRLLQEENQRLRSQAVADRTQIDDLNRRVDAAGARIDALLERLPLSTQSNPSCRKKRSTSPLLDASTGWLAHPKKKICC